MDPIQTLTNLQGSSGMITAATVLLNMTVTLILALFVFWIYQKTYQGVMYSRGFNITLVLVTLVTAMVMMVIGSNLALSLGMVGALSIVRFRSAMKDPRDVGFLFWGISAGLAAGTGSYLIAASGSLLIALTLWVLSVLRPERPTYLLILQARTLPAEDTLEEILQDYLDRRELRMRQVTREGSEWIYEVRVSRGLERKLVERCQEVDGVDQVQLVAHTGDIAGV